MRSRRFNNSLVGLAPKELALFGKLDTPRKIQDFVSAIPQNFEPDGDTCMSVREVLKKRRAHCIEGAMVAALALWVNGAEPLLLDFRATDDDFDHVVALFRRDGHFGAISKGNHVYTKYRDPIYRSVRELVMSYFHEYYNPKGKKTLREYSQPLNLSRYDPAEWITGKDAWKIAEDIDGLPHTRLVTRTQEKMLRPIEDVERRAAKIVAHKK